MSSVRSTTSGVRRTAGALPRLAAAGTAVVAMLLAAAGPAPAQTTAAPSPIQSCPATADATESAKVAIPVADLSTQIDAVASFVEQDRGLRFTARPQPVFATAAQVATRATPAAQLGPAPPDLGDLGALHAALGALPRGTDLATALARTDAASAPAGLYDAVAKQLLVQRSATADTLTTSTGQLVAHELERALSDQAFALDLPGIDDAGAATAALAEGDAYVTTLRYVIRTQSEADAVDLYGNLFGSSLTALPTPSGVLLADRPDLAARAGVRFVCQLYGLGGYKLVDAAFRAHPTTTAQILYPERMIEGEAAVDAPDPGELPSPWRRTTTTTLGAADLVVLFSAPGGDARHALPFPRELAKAWAGGEAAVWQSGEERAFGISLAQHDGFSGLCDSMRRWYRAAFPNARPVRRESGALSGEQFALGTARQTAVLRCKDGNARLGIAPDVGVARQLTG